MKEYPLFAPLGEDYLAAVVTEPEGPPRGLVLPGDRRRPDGLPRER